MAEGASASEIIARGHHLGVNLRQLDRHTIGVSLDETITRDDLELLLNVFAIDTAVDLDEIAGSPSFRKLASASIHGFERKSAYLTHPVFNSYHSETELLRYIFRLQGKDLSLAHSMIPLGSCTMKLNGTTEMIPVTWPEFGALHPFAPEDQTMGYQQLFDELESSLCEITGFDAISLQPNSGAQGEYAGLRVINAYLDSLGEHSRRVCLIPRSAHGTNPASAALAGMTVVPVECDEAGNLNMADLNKKAESHRDELACIMITYPSTFGVFEDKIREVCEVVHRHGGQVYMDGANMNAQGGALPPSRYRRRCVSFEFAQDFLHPSRRWWSWYGTHWSVCCSYPRFRSYLLIVS